MWLSQPGVGSSLQKSNGRIGIERLISKTERLREASGPLSACSHYTLSHPLDASSPPPPPASPMLIDVRARAAREKWDDRDVGRHAPRGERERDCRHAGLDWRQSSRDTLYICSSQWQAYRQRTPHAPTPIAPHSTRTHHHATATITFSRLTHTMVSSLPLSPSVFFSLSQTHARTHTYTAVTSCDHELCVENNSPLSRGAAIVVFRIIFTIRFPTSNNTTVANAPRMETVL